MRNFYFDIDGTVRDYEDRPFPALKTGALQRLLRQKDFDRYVCVSGWVWLARQGAGRNDQDYAAERIWTEVSSIFPDKADFLSRIAFAHDPDTRARFIDLVSDWYYADDWADKFFADAWGRDQFDRFLGTRICQVDPHGDGSDLLRFLAAL